MGKDLVSRIREKVKETIRKPLRTFLTAATLSIAPFFIGCGDTYTGPVYDEVADIDVRQIGGGWGWTVPYPDWILSADIGGGVPDDSKVNATGMNVFARFTDSNNAYIDVNDLPVRIKNSHSDSVLGIKYPGEVGWGQHNCTKENSYSGTCYLNTYNQSVTFATNGIGLWPIGGLYSIGDGKRGVMINELGRAFNITNKSGEFTIYCPASSTLVGATATYNFRKYTTDYWFPEWGQLCQQNFEPGSSMSAISMSMDNFEETDSDLAPNLSSLEKARTERGIVNVNPNNSNNLNKNNSDLEALVRSKPVIKKTPQKKEKVAYPDNLRICERTINPEDFKSTNKYIMAAGHVLEEAVEGVMGVLGIESEEPLLAYVTRDANEVWQAGAFYWLDSFNKPAGTEHINFLDEKFSEYGSTLMVRVKDANDTITSHHKVKFFPVHDGGDWIGGYSNDIVASHTPGSEGFYPPTDPNTPLYSARTVIPVKKGDRISSLMFIPGEAEFTMYDLREFCGSYLNNVDTCDYWDAWHDPDFDGNVTLRDFSIKARNWKKADYDWLTSETRADSKVPAEARKQIAASIALK